jgi:putative Mg2+ transporter-C (MgtC) family protein
MIVSAFGFQDVLGRPGFELDPSRIAAQVVSGIGFLGAGTILLRGEVIRGLTTAASLWSVAAIGLAIGGGLYTAAIASTLIILAILAGLKPIETKYFASKQTREIRLIATRGAMTLGHLDQALGARSERVKRFIIVQHEGLSDTDEVSISISRLTADEWRSICEQLKAIPGVREVNTTGAP